MSLDLYYTLSLLVVAALVVVAYGIRVLLRGPFHSARVDKHGGSPLLRKDLMEVGYWFFQHLGRLLVACHVTANQLSWASLVFGVIAGICLAFGHFGSGGCFAALSSLLDSLDGIVARATNSSSDAGEVLDAAVDRYVEFFFLGGLAVYYREVPTLLILALIALLGSFMVSYSSAKAEALQVTPPNGSMRRPERAVYLTSGALLSPVTIPWLEKVRELPIAVGHPMVIALCLVAVLANVSAIERLWVIARAVRENERRLKILQKAISESAVSEDSGLHPKIGKRPI